MQNCHTLTRKVSSDEGFSYCLCSSSPCLCSQHKKAGESKVVDQMMTSSLLTRQQGLRSWTDVLLRANAYQITPCIYIVASCEERV